MCTESPPPLPQMKLHENLFSGSRNVPQRTKSLAVQWNMQHFILLSRAHWCSGDALDLCLGGTRFKSRPGHRLAWVFSWSSSVPAVPRSDNGRVLPDRFQSSYHSTYWQRRKLSHKPSPFLREEGRLIRSPCRLEFCDPPPPPPFQLSSHWTD
jgi:hypothetical protein